MPGAFDPLALIDTLAAHEVSYIVDGGWAANQHGATRLTEDLDICPEISLGNLQRLADALLELQAELEIGPGQTLPVPIIDARLLSQMEIGTWETSAGGLDVLQRIAHPSDPAFRFEQLNEHATAVTVAGRTFLIAALADIVASKQAAGRPKDLEALPELTQLVRLADRNG